MLEELHVGAVPAPVHHEVPVNGQAGKGRIADKVQDLVPYELVVKPEPGCIDHSVVVKQDGVVKGTTLCKAHGLQVLNVLDEPECPCRGNFFGKAHLVNLYIHMLLPKHAVVEIYLVGDAPALIGHHGYLYLPFLEHHGLCHSQVRSVRCLPGKAFVAIHTANSFTAWFFISIRPLAKVI